MALFHQELQIVLLWMYEKHPEFLAVYGDSKVGESNLRVKVKEDIVLNYFLLSV